jgi:hypothetical protein
MKLLYLFSFKFYVRCVKFYFKFTYIMFEKVSASYRGCMVSHTCVCLLCMTAFWVLIPPYIQYYGEYCISFKFKYIGIKIVLTYNYNSKNVLNPDVPKCKVLCVFLHTHACMCMHTHTCASLSFTLYLNQHALKIVFHKLSSPLLI